MAILVTGDTHGHHDLQKVRQWDGGVGKGLGRDDFIVAGDFGYPWSFLPAECDEIRWLESRPYAVLFVDGNHERFDHWNERPVEECYSGRSELATEAHASRCRLAFAPDY